MLAFRDGDTGSDGYLGAMMWAEYQGMVVAAINAWSDGNKQAAKEARRKR